MQLCKNVLNIADTGVVTWNIANFNMKTNSGDL